MNESSEKEQESQANAEPLSAQQKAAKEQKLHAVMVMVVALLLVGGALVFIKFRLPKGEEPIPDSPRAIETQEDKDWAPLDEKRRKDTSFSALAPKMWEFTLPLKGLTDAQKKQLGPWVSQWVEKDRHSLLQAWHQSLINEQLSTTGSDESPLQSTLLSLNEYYPQALVVSEGQWQLRLLIDEGQVTSFLYLSNPPNATQLKETAQKLQRRFSPQSPYDSVPLIWRKQVENINALRQVRPGVAGGFIPYHQWQLLEQHPWYPQGALIQVKRLEQDISLTDDPGEEKTIPGYKDYEGIENWVGSIVVYHAVNGDVAIWKEAENQMAWLPRRQQKVIPLSTYGDFLKQFFDAANSGVYLTAP